MKKKTERKFNNRDPEFTLPKGALGIDWMSVIICSFIINALGIPLLKPAMDQPGVQRSERWRAPHVDPLGTQKPAGEKTKRTSIPFTHERKQ